MAGIYIPWLSDAARLTGFPVVEVAGWRTRGHGGYRVVDGIIAHHTGGPATGEYPSLGVVRDGRADLAGPLSAYGIGRSGTIYVIAAGVSWHAGASRWAGFTDLNDEFLGIEAESSGTGVWTAAQRAVYPRLCAAALYYMNRDASRIGAHREVALPAGRKPDPTGIDMNALRAQVAFMLGDPLRRIPRNGSPLPGGFPMAVRDEVWQTPVPDYYTPKNDTLWASECLAWGTTHAARARDYAAAASSKLDTVVGLLNAKGAPISGGSGAAGLTQGQVDAIADAVVAKLKTAGLRLS